MIQYSYEEYSEQFMIYKTLSNKNGMSTSLAMCEDSEGGLITVILKEMTEKRAFMYKELTSFWNPYIAEVYDVFEVINGEDKKMIAVTEYVTAEDSPAEESLSLETYVRKHGTLPKNVAMSICTQICEGLKEFHKKGFVHRDLKPENIMISRYDKENPKVKIIDFDAGKAVDHTKIADTTVIGTLGYQAPESLSGITTAQSDIYSIGCILNYMLTGQEPGIKVYHEDHNLVRILEKATNKDPNFRYNSVENLKKELEHELRIKWFDKIPVLRSIPGFRSHTPWKALMASIVYISIIYVMVVYASYGQYKDMAEVMLALVVIPLIFVCNLGNLLRFVPVRIRKNNILFILIRFLGTFLAIFGTTLLLIFKDLMNLGV